MKAFISKKMLFVLSNVELREKLSQQLETKDGKIYISKKLIESK